MKPILNVLERILLVGQDRACARQWLVAIESGNYTEAKQLMAYRRAVKARLKGGRR